MQTNKTTLASFVLYFLGPATVFLSLLVSPLPLRAEAEEEQEVFGKFVVLDAILTKRDKFVEAIRPPQNIFPAIPTSVQDASFSFYDQEGGVASDVVLLDEPDEIDPGGNSDESPYSLPHDFYYAYDLKEFPGDRLPLVTAALKSLSRTSLYATYMVLPRAEALKAPPYSVETDIYMRMNNIKPGDLPNLKARQELRARFSREVNLSGGQFDSDPPVPLSQDVADFSVYRAQDVAIRIPQEWRSLLDAQKLRRMWVECAVKVDSNGMPIDAPLRRMRPIAIETDSHLYAVIAAIKKVSNKHGYGVAFRNTAFSLIGGAENDIAKPMERLMSAFHRNLKAAFSRDPLLAEEDTASEATPGEFHFRRDYKRSGVLKGFSGPYKELSYYVIRWWKVDDQELYSVLPVHKGGFGATGRKIVVQASNILTIGVGASSDYSEPSREQVLAYQREITKAISNAIETTAKQFSGTANDAGFTIDITKIKQPGSEVE